MHWVILIVRIALAAILYPLMIGHLNRLIKTRGVTGQDFAAHSKQQLWLQYNWIALMLVVAAVVSGKGNDLYQGALHWSTAAVLVLGVLNALASYARRRAFLISQSWTAIFNQLDDLLAIVAGLVLLSEWKDSSPEWLFSGILLFVAALSMLAVGRARTERATVPVAALLGWVVVFGLIWGASKFAMRLGNLLSFGWFEYVFWFYLGTYIGAALLQRGRATKRILYSRGEHVEIFILAVVTLSSFLFLYWTFEFWPLSSGNVILAVGQIIGPAYIASRILKEESKLEGTDWIAVVLAVLSAVLVGLSQGV